MSAPVPSKTEPQPGPEKDQRGFDDVLGSLKQIVDKLESGQLSLEAALAAFEEGVRLARQGTQILDSAERRVEILTRGAPGEDQAPVAHPFDPSSNPTAGDKP
jgi:exodeoxyribonuclease VII small subunit